MFRHKKHFAGFSIIEILIALAILAIICGIGATVFINARKQAAQNSLTDSIVSLLEHAKADAMAGKNGAGAGINFSSDSYISFNGNSYNPANPTNQTYSIDKNLSLSNDIFNNTIVFIRISGLPSATGTITIRDLTNFKTQTIRIGDQGDILMIK